MPITKQTKLWGDKREWGVISGTKEVEINSVKILDSFGKESTRFEVGDKIIVKTEFAVHEEVNEPHFGVAIFRDDGVYCYGPNSLFDGHRINRLLKGKGNFSIEYERVLLMPGEYRLSVGIWDEKEVLPYSFHIAYYSLRILGSNRDKQLLFLPHKWNGDKSIDGFTAKKLILADLNFLEKRWQQKFSLENSNADIGSIQLLDAEGNIKSSFNTNETMGIRIKIKGLNWRNHLIWIGVFRIDGIYCHGVLGKMKEEEIILVYPQLSLLTGDYYFSIGLLDENKKDFLLYRHKAAVFKMSFLGQDHGTAYLEHSWKWELP